MSLGLNVEWNISAILILNSTLNKNNISNILRENKNSEPLNNFSGELSEDMNLYNFFLPFSYIKI